MKKKVIPILISLFVALCAFAGTFIGRNISVFLDVARHPERGTALNTAWRTNEVAAAALTAVVFALIFIAAYFYHQEKKSKENAGGGKKGGSDDE